MWIVYYTHIHFFLCNEVSSALAAVTTTVFSPRQLGKRLLFSLLEHLLSSHFVILFTTVLS